MTTVLNSGSTACPHTIMSQSQVTIPKRKKPRKVDPSQSSLLDYFSRTGQSKEPESTIPPSIMINKSLIEPQYKVSAADIAHLNFHEETIMRRIDDVYTPIITYFYPEREVERIAWSKHGGPKKFKEHLERLEHQFQNRQANKQHDSPDDAKSRVGKRHSFQKPLPLEFKEWVWKEVARHIVQNAIAIVEQRSIMRLAVPRTQCNSSGATHEGLHCPERPKASLPPSTSTDKLRAVLADASPTDQTRWIGAKGRERPQNAVYWQPAYLKKLFAALVDVVHEHGVESWALARWEVYDKFVECFGGIAYERRGRRWSDIARPWLCGRDQNSFVRTAGIGAAGEEYNSLLPQTDIYGLVHTEWCHHPRCGSI